MNIRAVFIFIIKALKANDKLLSGNKCRSSSQMNCSAIKNDKVTNLLKTGEFNYQESCDSSFCYIKYKVYI